MKNTIVSEEEFLDAVLHEIPDFKRILTYYERYDSLDLAVYSAAGSLGEKLSVLCASKAVSEGAAIQRIVNLAERAELSEISKVHDSIGTDFLPAVVENGPISKELFDCFGPALKRLVEKGRFAKEP